MAQEIDFPMLMLVIIIVILICYIIRFNNKERRFLCKYGKFFDRFKRFQCGTAATTSSENLFIKYGGLDTVQKITDGIATQSLNDTELAPFFSVLGKPGHDTPAVLKSTLDLMLSEMLGGPFMYPGRAFTRGVTPYGRDMKSSHKGLNITDEVYDRFVTIAIIPSLKDNGMIEEDINKLKPKLEKLRCQIVGL